MCKRPYVASLAVAIALVGFIAAGCGDDEIGLFAGNPTPTPTNTPFPLSSAMLLQPGPAGVGVTTMTFVDTSRPTMRNGGFPGAPARTLITEIWYPTAPDATASEAEHRDAPPASSGGPFPLIIYSHGFLSTRFGGGYLARHLATYGYVVASPDFPLTFAAAPGGANITDVANQPGDVSFLITQLLGLSAGSGNLFSGVLDPQRIGLTGLSLGGMTTYLAAFHPTLRDPRVRAAAPMAGPACFFGQAFFDDRTVPLLILHGDLDAIVAYPQNAVVAFQEGSPPKYLVTLLKGTHTGFSDFGTGTALFDRATNADDIGCAALSGTATGNPNLTDELGGPDAGIVMGDCPLPCTDPRPRPAAMKPSRQHQLALLSVIPFFEANFRANQRARQFLEQTLAAENSDVQVQLQTQP